MNELNASPRGLPGGGGACQQPLPEDRTPSAERKEEHKTRPGREAGCPSPAPTPGAPPVQPAPGSPRSPDLLPRF